jgi:hypothetical protein
MWLEISLNCFAAGQVSFKTITMPENCIYYLMKEKYLMWAGKLYVVGAENLSHTVYGVIHGPICCPRDWAVIRELGYSRTKCRRYCVDLKSGPL